MLAWWHRTDFPASDPILGRNVGFYVFTLPLLDLVRGLASRADRLGRRSGRPASTSSPASLRSRRLDYGWRRVCARHGAILAATLFLVLALGAWLDQPRQLVSASGIIQGASYTDVHARIPAALALTVASLVGAVLAVALCLGARAVGPHGRGAGTLRRWFSSAAACTRRHCSASPSRPTSWHAKRRTSSYNIEATRQGFALDRVEERELSGDAELTRADIERNRETHRQRPPVGSPAAAADVRPDCRRSVRTTTSSRSTTIATTSTAAAAGHALGARAEPGRAAKPHLDQRTARLHARTWRDTRARSTRSTAKACRCCSFATCRRCRRSTYR